MYWDFHLHSVFSDGTHTISELVEMAKANGVQNIALTDHDTVSGQTLMQETWGDGWISGIEVSCQWNRRGIHIVGLDFDIHHEAIVNLEIQQTERRELRNERIAHKLAKANVKGDVLGMARAISGEGQLCRPHIAQALVELGYANTTAEAFKQWIGNGKKGYAGIEWPTLKEGCNAILAAGGIPVLAHPAQYKLTRTKLITLVADFIAAGGMGVEVLTPDAKIDFQRSMASLCESNGLVVSGGSDFHSNLWGGRMLGKLSDYQPECPSIIELLKSRGSL